MNTHEKKVELLAPAGSVSTLKAVIEAGADAVYIGGTRFGARAYAENPGEEELIAAIDYAHLRGIRVYLTVNTLLKDTETAELIGFIEPYYIHGIDAVLVQDFGVLKILRENFPDLPLHASTQMTVTGPCSARMLGEYGVTRIVPARELSIGELKEIRDASGLEVEAFVHGAICVCYSGQCLMSSMIGGRSGNRGRCAQPCRLRYSLKTTGGSSGGNERQICTGELLSPKDMCALDHLPALIEAGVCSFKIEGRMKQAEYAAGVVSIYRKYLDLYNRKGRTGYQVADRDRKMLLTLFNRDGFTDGYLYRHNGPEMMALERRTLSAREEQERSALYDQLRKRYVDRKTDLSVRGAITLLTGRELTLTLTEKRTGKTVTADGGKVPAARTRPLDEQRIRDQIMKTGGQGFVFSELDIETDGQSFVPMAGLNTLRRSGFALLREEILKDYMRSEVIIRDTFPMKGGACPDRGSDKRPVLSASVETEEQFRAVLTEECVETIYIPYHFLCNKHTDHETVLLRAEHFRKASESHGRKLFLAMPYIERRDGMSEIGSFCGDLVKKGYSGFLVRSFETMARLREEGLASYVRLDSSIYSFNREAQTFLESFGFAYDTVPAELNRREIRNRTNDHSEMIVYGHLPLMITAQCLMKTAGCCDGRCPSVRLTDRRNRDFMVSCDCTFCYNIIRNPVVLSLLDEAEFCLKAGIGSFRLVFTDEDRESVLRVCEAARKAFRENNAANLSIEHTKGHFNRGVE